ncbi:MAG TPA: Sec-independent protein translocase protein TatB [Stellaceae bacterium]|jgi:sec-independent protein translocase protein TatB|nr:Sec-independent protein translocase protein TatB [Stellaceae bacterium]
MFDFSWSEILLIGVVALVVIGPKDLPRVLRTVGQWTGRARAIAREFQFQLDQMIRDSELDEVRKTMNAAATGDIDKTIRDFVDPTGEINASVSTSEMLGETPSAPPVASPPAATAPLSETVVAETPAIEAPMPVLLQPVVVGLAPAETSSVVPAPEEELRAEPKSGTHG